MWAQKVFALIMILGLAACSNGPSNTAESSPEAGAEIIQEADTATIDIVNPDGTPTLDTTEEAPLTAATEVIQTPETFAPPTETNQTPITSTGEMGTYTVRSGDTLMKIAFHLYGDIDKWTELYNLNKTALNSANSLLVGSTLQYQIPFSAPVIERNGDPYLIKRGDTLVSIAEDLYANRSKWRKIYDNNRQLIKDPDKIYAGFYLYYQMTEEERQHVMSVKGTAPASTSPAIPEENFDPTAEAPDMELQSKNTKSKTTVTVPSRYVAKDGETTGGLNKLANGKKSDTNRAPASVPSKQKW